MDLRLFLGVLGRFKWLLTAGVLLAAMLAIFAYGTPSLSHGHPAITPRSSETWESEAELEVTRNILAPSSRHGAAAATSANAAATSATAVESAGAEEGYFATLAPIYAAVANSDVVQEQLVLTRVPGKLKAAEVVATASGSTLPFITLTAAAPEARDASLLAQRASSILRRYVAAEQARTGTPASQRITLQVVKNGNPPVLTKGHKLTAPLLVFVAVVTAFLALAFVLENLNPRTAAALKRVPESSEVEAFALEDQRSDASDRESPATEPATSLGAVPLPHKGSAAWASHGQLGEAQR